MINRMIVKYRLTPKQPLEEYDVVTMTGLGSEYIKQLLQQLDRISKYWEARGYDMTLTDVEEYEDEEENGEL